MQAFTVTLRGDSYYEPRIEQGINVVVSNHYYVDLNGTKIVANPDAVVGKKIMSADFVDGRFEKAGMLLGNQAVVLINDMCGEGVVRMEGVRKIVAQGGEGTGIRKYLAIMHPGDEITFVRTYKRMFRSDQVQEECINFADTTLRYYPKSHRLEQQAPTTTLPPAMQKAEELLRQAAGSKPRLLEALRLMDEIQPQAARTPELRSTFIQNAVSLSKDLETAGDALAAAQSLKLALIALYSTPGDLFQHSEKERQQVTSELLRLQAGRGA